MNKFTFFGMFIISLLILLFTCSSALAIKEDKLLNIKPTYKTMSCKSGWQSAYKLPQETKGLYYCSQNKKYQICENIIDGKCSYIKDETRYLNEDGEEYGLIDIGLIKVGFKQPAYSREFKNEFKRSTDLLKNKIKDTEPDFDITSIEAKVVQDGKVEISYKYETYNAFDFSDVPIYIKDKFGTHPVSNNGAAIASIVSLPLELHFGATSEVYNISYYDPVGFNVTNGSKIVILNNIYDHPIKPNIGIEGWSNATHKTQNPILELNETSTTLNLTGLGLLNQQILWIYFNGSGTVSYNNLNSFNTWELSTYTDEIPTYNIENYYPLESSDCNWLYSCTNNSKNVTATINKDDMILWFAGKVINTT